MARKEPRSSSDRQRREEGVRDFFNEKRDQRITIYQLESFGVVLPKGITDKNIVNITVVHSNQNDFSERVPLTFVILDEAQNEITSDYVYLFKRNAVVDPNLPEEKEGELDEQEKGYLLRRLIDKEFSPSGDLVSFLKAKIGDMLPDGVNFAEIDSHEGERALIIEIQPEGEGVTRAFVYDRDSNKFEELLSAPLGKPKSRKGHWLIAGILAGTAAAVALVGKGHQGGAPSKTRVAQIDSSMPAQPGSPGVTVPVSRTPAGRTALEPNVAPNATSTVVASPEVKTPPAPSVPAEVAPPTSTAPGAPTIPAPEPAPNAEETARLAREALVLQLHQRLDRMKGEIGQYLNPQGLTAAQCDEAIERWSQAEGSAGQQQMTEQWRALRAFVVLQAEINGNLDRMMPTVGSAEPLEALKELLNPNRISVEQIDASITEWEKPEFADHPERGETLRRWRVWRFLVEFLETRVRPFEQAIQELR